MTSAEVDDAMARGRGRGRSTGATSCFSARWGSGIPRSRPPWLRDLGGTAETGSAAGTGAQAQDAWLPRSRVATEGLTRHAPTGTARHALAAFGGREQAAICGAVRRARDLRIPVILDGFICTAAAAVLTRDDPDALAHCLIGHESAEPGHRRLIASLAMQPILSLDMRLGEGSGAAVALLVLRAALECHNGMATFAEAGIV